ncbi:MAG: DNA repair ATPase [Verrucomicrobiae bacterium]|nr:DNA repair ATPase [Verrucomicrobiae bacterium]
MANHQESPPPVSATAPALESGTYEIIRSRLHEQATRLQDRLGSLNAARRETFGSIPFELLATERVLTENNCVPRDMAVFGPSRFVFGYNVHIGLKSETRIADVFSLYEYRGRQFHPLPVSWLEDPKFAGDFRDLYKYYKETVFSHFRNKAPYLYMVFQVGKNVSDVKAFKWQCGPGEPKYLGNRFDHEITFPPQHDFEWKRATRDLHRKGAFPHVSIEDRVFVETTGGDLTIKVENNTDIGEGIYSEPVSNRDQTLDDAEILYAIAGHLVLLKIRPFQENDHRYLVFNGKTNQVRRLDSIASSCVLLPDSQGIIFPGGYFLQTGESKTFDLPTGDMIFKKKITSPNGEDTLYTFFNRAAGLFILFSYNRIEQTVKTPILCNGFSVFENGETILFRCDEEPRKNHALQIWRTPFTHADAAPAVPADSFLGKIGNAGVVACMTDCHALLNLLKKEDSYANLYLDVVRLTTDLIDNHFWIGDAAAFNLREPLEGIRKAGRSAIDEFEKVTGIRKSTSRETARLQSQSAALTSRISQTIPESIDVFVDFLSALRRLRGEIISARDLRYADLPLLDSLEREVVAQLDRLSAECVVFLIKPEALNPYRTRVEAEKNALDAVTKSAEADGQDKRLAAISSEMDMLIEIVGNLKIEDPTQTTAIIDSISTLYAGLNQIKSSLKNKRTELAVTEGSAQFAAQVKLLNQTVTHYIDLCDSPKKCDELLTRLMVQVEELEGRFSEVDAYVEELSVKREEIYNAFDARKIQLNESRNKRCAALQASADRVLTGVKNKAESLKNLDEINSYFASDLMVDKVRDLITQLTGLEDSVRADEIQSRLKTIQEGAVRQLKDRLELFVDGQNVIQLGPHRFSVNTQPLDLTVVPRDGDMYFHLSGSNFFEKITDAGFTTTREVWSQEIVSETETVYRAEYLAHLIFLEALAAPPQKLEEWLSLETEPFAERVRQFAATRLTEGYVKGVHDLDAAAILRPLMTIHRDLNLLRYPPRARALARLFWSQWTEEEIRQPLTLKIKSHGTLSRFFAGQTPPREYIRALAGPLAQFAEKSALFPPALAPLAAEYLFVEVSTRDRFAVSRPASQLATDFFHHLTHHLFVSEFDKALESAGRDKITAFEIARDWLAGFMTASSVGPETEMLEEAAVLILNRDAPPPEVIDATATASLSNLHGNHPRITGGNYVLQYHEFTGRLDDFTRTRVPLFERYSQAKKQLIEVRRKELRLGEFKPKVLSSFTRNRLVDRFYLPLVGANLAKQIGEAGENKRTDLMGLLLLISPPGYGKTTLVEYLAFRLGLTFVKINGPALGHDVTSLDPEEAPNAAAREEIKRLNLALEMGDNVMLIIDDIQHCNPEFLQKFISLCDAQRKIEGVYNNQPRTYDLRGRKFAVVMAGNPYTESGDRFRIPDMLANRADIYNLGDIVGRHFQVFKWSYLENAATSNPYLRRLAGRNHDLHAVIQMAETGSAEGVELEGKYSPEETGEMVAVMKALLRIRDVVLRMNQEYIASAAQAEDYRTEPPFKLQGSYRNMNRLAEKALPVMNDSEIQALIDEHYRNDAQTLTTGAESNLLKYKEMRGTLTAEESARWNEIKSTYKRKLLFSEADPGDPVARVTVQLSAFAQGLDQIRQALSEVAQTQRERPDQLETALSSHTLESLRHMLGELRTTIETSSHPPVPPLPRMTGSPAVTLLNEDGTPAPASLASHSPPVVDHQPTAAPPASNPDYQIEVRYSVPEAFTQIIQHQFALMQAWSQSAFASQNLRSKEMQDLHAQVARLLDDYHQITGWLKTAPQTPFPQDITSAETGSALKKPKKRKPE